MNKIQSYINHIAFVIDSSSSMAHLAEDVVKIFDAQVDYLRKRSREMDQETRISVYSFGVSVDCLVFDMDCLRMPSINKFYRAYGNTPLIDASHLAISDMKKIPELYGDSSFLIYVITDGAENSSKKTSRELQHLIQSLRENWTLAVFVPDKYGENYAYQSGFPKNNISIWNADSVKGIEQIGKTIQKTTDDYMTARQKGVRGTTNLFQINTGITSEQVVNNLEPLNPSDYLLLNVYSESVIKSFVESWTQKSYVSGSAYYQLVKSETIQFHKQIVVQNKLSGKVYAGIAARKILGLPDQTVKISKTNLDNFEIFVQSSSVNRKLPAGTKLIVIL